MADEVGRIPPGFVVLGHIARPHGVHGAVIITPYTDNPQLILDGQGLEFLSPDGEIRRPVASMKGKPAAQGLIVKIKNITTREAAQALKGWRVGLERGLLPETREDEVYWADLIGLDLYTPDGLNFGRVTNLMEAGAGLILVAAGPDGPDHELLIPFHEQFVVDLDLDGGRLTMDLPPGLLDLQSP